jgi:nucleotide-binding universal stress UspA family protein
MLRIECIVCPVDFSEYSSRAYDYAYSLAKHYGSKLFLEHVVQPFAMAYPNYSFPDSMAQDVFSSLIADAEKRLTELVSTHSWDAFKPECTVERGMVPDAILSFAEERSADLIVMGAHGRRGLDRLTMGSATEKVLRRAHCPVLAVRKPVHDFVTPGEKQDPVHLRKILFCTDFSDNSGRAADYAFSLAMEYNAEITLLHVAEDLGYSADLQAVTRESMRALEKSVPPEARDWCRVKCTVRIGKPYQEIVQLALEAQSDVVIVGVRGRSTLDLALFGSTSHRVIQLGTCPVLSVRM